MSNQSSINETTNGRWTKEEHEKFLVGLQMFGKNWKKIEGFIGTRNGSQIRSHAQKFFIKVKKTLQTEESDSQNDVISTIQEQPSNQIEKSNDHSYFFQQIVKRSQNEQSFNFWAVLIDHNCQNIKENIQIRRKNSFISFQSGQDSNNQLQLGSEPRKRIKI